MGKAILRHNELLRVRAVVPLTCKLLSINQRDRFTLDLGEVKETQLEVKSFWLHTIDFGCFETNKFELEGLGFQRVGKFKLGLQFLGVHHSP